MWVNINVFLIFEGLYELIQVEKWQSGTWSMLDLTKINVESTKCNVKRYEQSVDRIMLLNHCWASQASTLETSHFI